MGLFDKFSKKKKKETDVEGAVEKKENVIDKDTEKEVVNEKEAPKAKEENSTASEEKAPESGADTPKVDNSGRFTLMIENMLQLENDLGVAAVGNVHGTINEHDKVYILHPAMPKAIYTEIDSIEIGPDSTAATATDCKVVLKISGIKDRNLIPKFSVITNIRPQFEVNKPAENPFLLGLSYEYPRFTKDRGYYNIMTFAIFSSRFLTPIRIDNEPEKKPDGTAVLTKNTKVGFRLLKHPQDESMHVLPVFTDWQSLKNWKDAFEGETQPKTMLMNFDQCADIGVKNKAGFVINPYGPIPVYVSLEMINSIYKMKAELDQKIAEAKKKENKDSESKA